MRTADGQHCGRIRDVYFDDSSWAVTHLLLSIEPSVAARKQLLLTPAHIAFLEEGRSILGLSLRAEELEDLPLDSSVLPVCKQYAALTFALSAPGKAGIARAANPHLRSARAVVHYQLDAAGESSGRLADLIYDERSWQIRYLGMEQKFDGKTMRFHVLPQAVERISWSTQRVYLKGLKPVAVSLAERSQDKPSQAVA